METPPDDAALPGPLLDELLGVAMDVARACGRLITDERPRDLVADHFKTSSTDVVTIMDPRSEALARAELARRRPEDGVVGEEGTDVPGTSGIWWLVDPIDGTANYLYDMGYYAVSVAAVVGDPHVSRAWYPVAGAVYNPVSDEMYLGRRGGGSFVETGGVRTPLAVGTRTELARCLTGTGFGYAPPSRAKQGRVVAQVLPRVRDIRRMGVAALDLCHVARGRLDCYYEAGVNAWDIAAGWVILEEAGGVLRGTGGQRPSRLLTFAGQGPALDELEELVVGLLREIDPDAPEPDLS